MTLIQAIVLGIIQGLTELLPISSSGHLALVPKLLNWEVQSIVFDELVHIASFIAVLLFFRKDVWKIATDTINIFFKEGLKKDSSFWNTLGFKLVIASIPTFVVGVLFKDQIEALTDNHILIAIMLIALGIVFLFIENISKGNKKLPEEVSKKDALIIGLTQPIALVRGVSRSGITITAGLLWGKLNKESAARFSFYLSLIVMAALSAKGIYDIFTHPDPESLLILGVGTLASFLSSLLAVKLLLVVMKRDMFKLFGIYRILLGIITLIVL